MEHIRNIKLEILRHGPAHNQLLSPLTPYLAICRREGPQTIHLPFEQRQMLARLARLRYYSGKNRISDSQRETELADLGEILGRVLGEIPGLISELGSVRAREKVLVHLRLAVSANELALVPFECAIGSSGFPGSGSPLLLQADTPIALTREIRNGPEHEVKWNRTPRILFIYASPEGLAQVPADRHLLALRQAMAPWISKHDDAAEQLKEVSSRITVLPNATLNQIRRTCAEDAYSHVHILAHGAPYSEGEDERFGLALCSESDPARMDVVDNKRLALALITKRATNYGDGQLPTVVSLATCDSANNGTVLAPGGSIAYELHAAGIPWVFASQFPLWMRSSTIFTSVLYKRLLQGGDPRCVLYELRQRLRTSCPETHDWASIVAYATVPPNFDDEVEAFFDRQNKQRIEAQLSRIDRLLDVSIHKEKLFDDCEREINCLRDNIRKTLKQWEDGRGKEESAEKKAERLGVCGACEKRLGVAYARLSEKAAEMEGDDTSTLMLQKSAASYQDSLTCYRQAVDEAPGNHWQITQFLSMLAVCNPNENTNILKSRGSHWWQMAMEICQRDATIKSGLERGWAYSSLSELELLGLIYGGSEYKDLRNKEQVADRITEACWSLYEIYGPHDFTVQATIRQFHRYLLPTWKTKWNLAEMAKYALRAFGINNAEHTTGSC